MTRITEDGYEVQDHTIIIEAINEYHNPEYSHLVPNVTEAKEVPLDRPIWRNRWNCHRYCNEVNELKKEIR